MDPGAPLQPAGPSGRGRAPAVAQRPLRAAQRPAQPRLRRQRPAAEDEVRRIPARGGRRRPPLRRRRGRHPLPHADRHDAPAAPSPAPRPLPAGRPARGHRAGRRPDLPRLLRRGPRPGRPRGHRPLRRRDRLHRPAAPAHRLTLPGHRAPAPFAAGGLRPRRDQALRPPRRARQAAAQQGPGRLPRAHPPPADQRPPAAPLPLPRHRGLPVHGRLLPRPPVGRRGGPAGPASAVVAPQATSITASPGLTSITASPGLFPVLPLRRDRLRDPLHRSAGERDRPGPERRPRVGGPRGCPQRRFQRLGPAGFRSALRAQRERPRAPRPLPARQLPVLDGAAPRHPAGRGIREHAGLRGPQVAVRGDLRQPRRAGLVARHPQRPLHRPPDAQWQPGLVRAGLRPAGHQLQPGLHRAPPGRQRGAADQSGGPRRPTSTSW